MFDISDFHSIGCVTGTGRCSDGSLLRFSGSDAQTVLTEIGGDGRLVSCHRMLATASGTLRPKNGTPGTYNLFRPALAANPAQRHWADPFSSYQMHGCPLESFVAATAEAWPGLKPPTSTAGWTGTCGLMCSAGVDRNSLRLAVRPFPGVRRPDHLSEGVFDLRSGCLVEQSLVRTVNGATISRILYADFIDVHGAPLPKTCTYQAFEGSRPDEAPSLVRTVTYEGFSAFDPTLLAQQMWVPEAGSTINELLQ